MIIVVEALDFLVPLGEIVFGINSKAGDTVEAENLMSRRLVARKTRKRNNTHVLEEGSHRSEFRIDDDAARPLNLLLRFGGSCWKDWLAIREGNVVDVVTTQIICANPGADIHFGALHGLPLLQLCRLVDDGGVWWVPWCSRVTSSMTEWCGGPPSAPLSDGSG